MPKTRWALAVMAAGAMVLAGLVHYPALETGFIADDFLQNEILDGTFPIHRSPLDLFTFARPVPGEIQALRDHGGLPWWSYPKLRLSAFRPLASLAIVVDHALGLSAFARHLHSLLWWFAMVAAFAVLLQELLPPAAWPLSLFVFALSPARIVPLAWLANRSGLMCALFGILGVYGYVRYRRKLARFGPLGPLLAFAGTLLSGEYGLSALGYVAAYEICMSDEPPLRRLRAVSPLAALTTIYFVLYAALGFGPSGSSLYTSPISEPKVFLSDAGKRFSALLGDSLLLWPADETHIALWLNPFAIVVLLVALGGVAIVVRGARVSTAPTTRVIDFSALGLLLSLVPLLGTIPSTRLLLIPSVGASLLIGALFWEVTRQLRSPEPLSVFARIGLWVRVAVTAILVFRHSWGAMEIAWTASHTMRDGRQFIQAVCDNADIDDVHAATENVVLLNASEPEALLYVPRIRHEHGSPLPESYLTLAMSVFPVGVRRVADDTLELFVIQGTLLDNPVASVVRRFDLPLLAGDKVHLKHVDIEVMESGPRRVQFRFDRPLLDPTLRFLALTPHGMRRFVVPEPGAIAIAGLEAPLPPKSPSDVPPVAAPPGHP